MRGEGGGVRIGCGRVAGREVDESGRMYRGQKREKAGETEERKKKKKRRRRRNDEEEKKELGLGSG